MIPQKTDTFKKPTFRKQERTAAQPQDISRIKFLFLSSSSPRVHLQSITFRFLKYPLTQSTGKVELGKDGFFQQILIDYSTIR